MIPRLVKTFCITKIILVFCLFSSCRENTQTNKTVLQVPYQEAKFSIKGKWKIDSLWTLENNKPINPTRSIIPTIWTFKGNQWSLQSKPISVSMDGMDLEMVNPANKISSNYIINDSILTIEIYGLKYKITALDSNTMYLKTYKQPVHNLMKFVAEK